MCKKNSFETIYHLKSKKILRCKNDGLFLSQNIKKPQKIYGRKYFNTPPHPPSANNKYFLEKLVKIRSLTGKNNPRILDVGCGWGNFLEFLRKENINYRGIDNSEEAINICKSKKLNCQKISLEKLIDRDKAKYDAITFFQVIEHLKNPFPFFQSARKLLKKNGVLLITTPNNDSPLRKIFGNKWSVYQENSHFVFYNKSTLFQTLKLAGFKKIKVRTDSMRFLSLKYVLNKLNLEIGNWKLEIGKLEIDPIPIPTDPFGDLEAFAFQQ